MTGPHRTGGRAPWFSFLRALGIWALKWGGLGLALILTAALSGYLSMRKAVRGGEVNVPTVEGMTVSEAVQVLTRNGLILEKSGERTDQRLPAGEILVQDPPGGARLKRNRKVKVVVSLGTEVLKVPQLVDQPARRAQIALQQEGLRLGEIAYAYSDSVEGDRILAQEPPPGAVRAREGMVDLLVSKGKRPKVWVMPSVEGQLLGQVTHLFADAGLRVGAVRREPAPGVPAGTVVRQYPLAGYPLGEGDSISLVVSAEVQDDG